MTALWVGTDNSGGAYWVEDGVHYGVHYTTQSCGNGDQFYWGENKPTFGFSDHYPGGSVGFNVNYAMKIVFTVGTTWNVYRAGTLIGQSASNPCCSDDLAAGGETTLAGASDHGEASGLQKVIGTTWSYGWGGATTYNPQGLFTMSGTPSSDELWAAG